MNPTLAYFSAKYRNPGLWYLAMFALTPHPINSEMVYLDPESGQRVYADRLPSDKYVPESKVIRDVGTEADLLDSLNPNRGLTPREQQAYELAKLESKTRKNKGKLSKAQQAALKKYEQLETRKAAMEEAYRPRQIQAVQRKQILRPKALRLDQMNAIEPALTNGDVLNNAYTALKDPRVKSHINDAGVLNRYHRTLLGQASASELAMPPITAQQAQEAKARLAKLTDQEWDQITNAHRAVNDIKERAVPVSEVISDRTSPINRPAKPDTVQEMKASQARLVEQTAKEGIDPRTAARAAPDLYPDASSVRIDPPAYVNNPESIAYAIDDSPAAQKAKRQAMEVSYRPKRTGAGQYSGLNRRLQRLNNARALVQQPDLEFDTPEIRAATQKADAAKALPPKTSGSASLTTPPVPKSSNKPQTEIVDELNSLFDNNALKAHPTEIAKPPIQPVPSAALPEVVIPPPSKAPTIPSPAKKPPTGANTSLVSRLKNKQQELRDWYMSNVVNPSNNPPVTTAATPQPATPQPATPQPAPATTSPTATPPPAVPVTASPTATPSAASSPATTAASATTNPQSTAPKKLTIKVGRKNKGAVKVAKARSPAQIYQDSVKAEEAAAREAARAKQAASKIDDAAKVVKPRPLKLMSNFPNLTGGQKGGLLRLGAGVLGAGGLLLGGSLLANSLVSQKRERELARADRLYGQPPSPPPPTYNPYSPPPNYY